MKVLFVHLLNNYTGSPQVLRNFLLSRDELYDVSILTSKTDGCLSNIHGVKYYWNSYKWISNRFLLSILLILSHIKQFFFILFGPKYDCIYINTILPFGAAVAAHIRRERIIYHIHEFYEKPGIMQKVCINIAENCADEVIFVSEYLEECYKHKFKCPVCVVHNSVSLEFQDAAKQIIFQDEYLINKFNNKLIVLPCGMKKYKGVFLFIELAKMCPNYNFLLVTSNTETETVKFLKAIELPNNLKFKYQEKNMGAIYRNASLVLNLSIPHGRIKWIETFGMTLIEAFEYLTPVIAPCYGGPLEVVSDGFDGYLVEPENISLVKEKIDFLLNDFENYKNFSDNTKIKKDYFNPTMLSKNIVQIISKYK